MKIKNKKKLLMFLLPMLAIGLIAAAVTYYAVFSVSFTVNPSIVIGSCDDTLADVYDGETYIGKECTLTNDAPTEREITISEDSETDIEVNYIGTLRLSQKVVEFGVTPWVEVPNTDVLVEYTIVGNEFLAEVVEGYEQEGYVLVYYADEDDRFANPGETVSVVGLSGNLPAVDDENADLNDYSNEYPLTPHGAKLWYVPEESVGEVDWSDASNFYFETALIQFNTGGNLVMYPGQSLTITPIYEIGIGVSGSKTITTTIA